LSSGFEIDVLESTERGLLTKPAKHRPPSVTLKRGMTSGLELWAWHELVMNGILGAAQKDVTLVIYNETGTPGRALPPRECLACEVGDRRPEGRL
jgi:phage tail-like protein